MKCLKKIYIVVGLVACILWNAAVGVRSAKVILKESIEIRKILNSEEDPLLLRISSEYNKRKK